LLFIPTVFPFTLHRYVGEVPPLNGTAVKVTGDPWQTGFEEAQMETFTGTIFITDMVMELEFAGLPRIQG
jgi:hypothetical protein